jgi:hypothetical protein
MQRFLHKELSRVMNVLVNKIVKAMVQLETKGKLPLKYILKKELAIPYILTTGLIFLFP